MYRFLAHFFYLVIYFLGVLFFGFYVGSRHGSSVKCVMGKMFLYCEFPLHVIYHFFVVGMLLNFM